MIRPHALSLPRSLPFVALASLATLGCVHSGHSSPKPPSGPLALRESESNDHPQSANFVGYVRPGDRFVIEGDMGFGGDPQDGFAFVALEPCQIEYTLSVASSSAAFGLCVYDPFSDEIVFCDASGYNPELGLFYVDLFDVEFHTVVVPLYGAASYTLSVDVYPHGYAPASAAPGATPGASPSAAGPLARTPRAELEAAAEDAGAGRLLPDAAHVEESAELRLRALDYRRPRSSRRTPPGLAARQTGLLVVLDGDRAEVAPVYALAPPR